MGMYCKGCGRQHEEDDGRLCAVCQVFEEGIDDEYARSEPTPELMARIDAICDAAEREIGGAE